MEEHIPDPFDGLLEEPNALAKFGSKLFEVVPLAAGWANPLANGLDAAVVNAGFINKLFPLMFKFWFCDCIVW